MYADGSTMVDQVGFAVVLPSKTLTGGQPGAASIFTAKVYADTTAIEELLENHKMCCMVFSRLPKHPAGHQIKCF